MFRTIVVGTDGSPAADQAMEGAIRLADRTSEPVIHVVTAYFPLSSPELSPIAAYLPDDVIEGLTPQAAADMTLDAAQARFRAAGIEPHLHRSSRDASDALLEAAVKYDADLLIVGSRRHGLIGRALLGSVSTKIVHGAPCTVLVVRLGSDR